MGCNSNFLKGCAGKQKHKNWLAADYFLKNEHADPGAEVYKCKCGFFHIGSRKLKNGNKIVKYKKRENEQQHKRKHKRFKY